MQGTKDHVLDYAGFVDFVTVVHEHVTGLRSWHRRPLPVSDGGIRDGDATSATSLADDGASARGLWPAGGNLQTYRDEDSGVGRTRNTTRQEAAVAVESPAAETKVEADEKRGSPYGDDQLRMGRPNEATPWLGWDLAGLEDKVQAPDGNKSVGNTPPSQNIDPARSPAGRQHARDEETAGTRRWERGGDRDGDKHNDYERETDKKEDQEGDDEAKGQQGRHDQGSKEEPKINRAYGSTEGGQAASVNKIIAFQSDRVVRMLEGMFQ